MAINIRPVLTREEAIDEATRRVKAGATWRWTANGLGVVVPPEQYWGMPDLPTAIRAEYRRIMADAT